ncbi:MAG TPA: hypothetical protein VF014_06515 [Casimicrobiaceae bacterium]|nr:hypothetical protein [Casimicrobiaceae bacterium]
MRKGLKAEAIYARLDVLERLRMPCEVNMIFFDPYLTLVGVRSNLALLEHIGRSKYLSYSHAFPFNELKPFAWSPVAARLRVKGCWTKQLIPRGSGILRSPSLRCSCVDCGATFR